MTPKINASAKLYLLVLVMSIFIIGIGFYGIVKMKTMNQNTQTLYADRVVPLKQLTSIRFFYSFGILSAAEQIQTSQLTFKEAKSKIQESAKNIDVNWKAYMLTYLTPEEEQLAKQASILISQSTEFIGRLNAVLDKEDRQGLNNIINKELYPAINPLINKIAELIDLQVRVSGEIYNHSAAVYSTSSKEFYLIIILSLVFAIPLSIFIVRNIKDLINRLKVSELECTKINNNLLQRNKDLRQFAYIVSHNLRAPVANIIGITSGISNMQLKPEEEKKMIGHLGTSVQKLDDVLKDLNHILQVKHNANEQKELVHFPELLNDIQLSIDNLIHKEQVQFITDFTEVSKMHTLKGYLHSIFLHLILNSIKYRQPNKKPVIEIIGKKFDNKIELIFKDNGLGIDLKRWGDQVFGLYKRFHTHTEGKGMGLYMMKVQVKALGGNVSIKSEVNRGTEFCIEFDNYKEH